jgi:outer membrane immunogenic protein
MRFLVAVVATAIGISAASAADVAPRIYTKAPPPPPPVYDWTGFYLGGNVGLGFGRNLTTLAIPAVFSGETYRLGDSGVLGGGQIGYNVQWNWLVLGVEADLQGANLHDDRTCMFLCAPLASNIMQYDQKLDWFGTVRGRVGIADGPTFNYFTAGFAYGGVETNLTGAVGAGARGNFTLDETRSGWTIGSGVEAALGGNWTAKIEYLYLNLGTQAASFNFGPAALGLTSDIRQHVFRGGLNYRFGGPGSYAIGPVANWTGFYIGGNAGSATALNQSSHTAIGNPLFVVNQAEQFNLNPDGFAGGAQIGYNWQTGNWVYGVEADIQGSTQKDDDTCGTSCSIAGASRFDQQMPWFGTVRGRLGYSIGPSLFYATGGLAYGEVKTQIDDTALFFLTRATPEFSHTKTGWTIGAGIETPFTWLGTWLGGNWTVKTEYLYVDLGEMTDTYTNGAETHVFSTDVQNHIFRSGLNYRF